MFYLVNLHEKKITYDSWIFYLWISKSLSEDIVKICNQKVIFITHIGI
jgi:hypothetical protein